MSLLLNQTIIKKDFLKDFMMGQKEHITAIPSDRLQYFPVMMFAIVMGFSGLTLVLGKLHHELFFQDL